MSPVTRLTPSTPDVHTTLAFHEEERRRLTQVFNAHSRAATLPASVLALIFLEQAASFYERRLALWYGTDGEYISEPSHKPIYSWVAVSYVCRSWREAALHCAELWTTIVLDERVKAEFIELLLDRSKGLPLTVVLHAAQEDYHCPGCSAEGDCGDKNYDDAVKILGKILPRTRKLSVFITKHDHDEVWRALQGLADATKLEYLRLEATGFLRYEPPSEYSSGRVHAKIPSSIPSTAPPNLSSLVVCGVRLGWSNQVLCSTLRHLKVSVYKSGKGTHLGHFVAALNNLPLLESLDIDELSSVGRGGAIGRASLPYLQNLCISLENQNSAPFLLSLDLPLTISILLYTKSHRLRSLNKEHDIPETVQTVIVAAIKEFLARETVYAISYDCKDGTSRWDCPPRTSLWSRAQCDARGDDILSWQAVETHPPRLACSASLDSPIVTKLLAALPLQSIHALRIQEREVALPVGSALCGWTRPAYLDAPVTNLRDDDPPPKWYGFGDVDDDCWDRPTEEQGHDAKSSPAANAPNPQRVPCGPPLPLLFPRLRALGFSGVDFPIARPYAGRKPYKHKPSFWDMLGIPYGLDVKSIVKSLRLRSGAGASKVVRMDFDNCQCVEKEQLLPLIEAVPEVIWDGRRITAQDLREGA
ncbi:hypothetical protein C8T65DRAFT_825218 [Cerioporus squamosus]|nr:hypothetical protein C8T65DRAFT_825218 [Cerioporus squamosus]